MKSPSRAPLVLLIPLLVLPGMVVYRSSSQRPAEPIFIGLAAINAVCFLAYWADKRRAESGGWRVPEVTLHLLEFAGGWPAAFAAQQLFRHKTAKLSYQIVFWLIVASHQFLALDYVLDWQLSRAAWRLVSS